MKTKITESFIDLSLQKKTTKIPVRHLCEHMGISRTTFYKHFKDTYDIIESVFIQDVFQEKPDFSGFFLFLRWYDWYECVKV